MTDGNADNASPQRLAIRRLRDTLRESVETFTELEARIDNAPTEHKDSLLRAAASCAGEIGVIGHDVRRELLGLIGLYPF